MTKYRNRPVTIDGLRFASQAEGARYVHLRTLQRSGHITELQCQVAYELAPAVLIRGAKRKTPALRYFADFSYIDSTGVRQVEDVKGGKNTQAFVIKRHLMACRGVHITEIRK